MGTQIGSTTAPAKRPTTGNNDKKQDNKRTTKPLAWARIVGDPEKLTTIHQLCPNVFMYTFHVKLFRGLEIRGRCTFVQMQSGAIAVFSPLPLAETVRDRLKRLGDNVQYIIAPSRGHHMFLHEWHTAFPSARIIGPSGLQERIDNIKDSDKVRVNRHIQQGETSGSVDPVFSQDFDMVSFDMVPSGDLVFRHIPSGSVIEADLFYNISRRREIECGPLREAYAFTVMKPPRWIQWVTCMFRGKSRHESYAASVRVIESWTFDRVIPCHGDIIFPGNNGKAQFIAELRKGLCLKRPE